MARHAILIKPMPSCSGAYYEARDTSPARYARESVPEDRLLIPINLIS
jgi:hypothetical protein